MKTDFWNVEYILSNIKIGNNEALIDSAMFTDEEVSLDEHKAFHNAIQVADNYLAAQGFTMRELIEYPDSYTQTWRK